MQNTLERSHLYPFAFAAFPVLSLLAANVTEVKAGDAVRALGLALAATGVLLIATRVLLRSWAKAAVLTSLLVLLFFGASRLPAVGASLGKAVRSFKDAAAGDPDGTPSVKPEVRDAPGDRKP